jgi:hypothetical protein
MSVSAGAWHGGPMTTSGADCGRGGVGERSHGLIVIGASSRIPLPGWVHRAPLRAVTPLVQVRATRLVGSAPRAGFGCAGEAA